MKEMPATLMLRPFGGDTLAVKVYNATSEGLWADAAVPALVIVLIAAIPTALLLGGQSSSSLPVVARQQARRRAVDQR
jgi:iron(III) transport system permease protein